VSARLNLSSQPFRNRTLPWTIAGIITLASIAALLFITVKSSELNRQAMVVERDVNVLSQQLKDYDKKMSEIRQALTPEQRKLHDAAHGLVDRKHFSWTRLFVDLEASVPDKVRVSRINVRDVGTRGGQTVADLELSVVSRDPAEVTGMMNKMNGTGIFRADLVTQNPNKGRGEGAEWVLAVRYAQRGSSAPTAASAENSGRSADALAQTVAAEVKR
jgi:Tfp pilus assembly protein PilN